MAPVRPRGVTVPWIGAVSIAIASTAVLGAETRTVHGVSAGIVIDMFDTVPSASGIGCTRQSREPTMPVHSIASTHTAPSMTRHHAGNSDANAPVRSSTASVRRNESFHADNASCNAGSIMGLPLWQSRRFGVDAAKAKRHRKKAA